MISIVWTVLAMVGLGAALVGLGALVEAEVAPLLVAWATGR
jgi:hypothetical protein